MTLDRTSHGDMALTPSRGPALRRAFASALVALALSLGYSSARADDQSQPRTPPAGTVSIESRSVKTADGKTIPYEMGTLYVPENRAAASSRVIGVGFARIKATAPTQAPPIIFLPGGPGASYLDAFTGTSENSRRRLSMFHGYSAVADVVVFDQRGFSSRGTMLQMPSMPPAPLDRPGSVQASTEAWRAFAKAAIAANPTQDLSGYTITQCAADVNDLRKALGYSRVSLLGTSFGSQWSFAIMRLHPDIVVRAVLSGVEPLDANFDMPSHVFAAIQRIASDADRAPGLQPYLPAGGLMTAVRELRDRFARGPVKVEVTNPKTGKAEAVVLGLEDFQAALVPEDNEAWPAFVLALYHGHYEGWARAEIANRRGPLFSTPINPLIDSGLGVSAARNHLLHTDPATHFLGAWNFGPHQGSRASWPTPDFGDVLRTPAASPIPVVFLNGDWDVSTPIESMLEIAPYFRGSRTVIVHRDEHAQPSRLTRNHPEVFAAILEFFRSGKTDKLPSEITQAVPSFVVPAFPPPAKRAP